MKYSFDFEGDRVFFLNDPIFGDGNGAFSGYPVWSRDFWESAFRGNAEDVKKIAYGNKLHHFLVDSAAAEKFLDLSVNDKIIVETNGDADEFVSARHIR